MPVPVFLPTTLDSTEKILAAIEELRGKVPSNPLESELMTLSGMLPEHDGKTEVPDMASELVTMYLTLWSDGVYINEEEVFFDDRGIFFHCNGAIVEFLY